MHPVISIGAKIRTDTKRDVKMKDFEIITYQIYIEPSSNLRENVQTYIFERGFLNIIKKI
jgi:hypothetical protein